MPRRRARRRAPSQLPHEGVVVTHRPEHQLSSVGFTVGNGGPAAELDVAVSPGRAHFRLAFSSTAGLETTSASGPTSISTAPASVRGSGSRARAARSFAAAVA